MAVILGLLAAAAVAKGVSAVSKAKAASKAGKEDLRARTDLFGQQEDTRLRRNSASKALLAKLFGGRYDIPPEVFQQMQQKRAYTGADPTKGSGWNAVGDVSGAVGDAAFNAAAMKGGLPSSGGSKGSAFGTPSSGSVSSPSGTGVGFGNWSAMPATAYPPPPAYIPPPYGY